MHYNIGDIIGDDNHELIIIDKMYKSSGKQKRWFYKYKCSRCGFNCQNVYKGEKHIDELWVVEYQLSRKSTCSCCNGKVASVNINSVSKLRPDLVKYFVDKKDADKYTIGSSKEVSLKCPDCCQFTKKMTVSKLVSRGFNCPSCSDKLPMGEKLMYLLLSDLKVEFIKEFSFDSGKHRYDFYLPERNMVIEIHGCQHFQGNFSTFSRGRTLQEEQLSDRVKYEIARLNGVDKYIIIDARNSDYEYIKSSIIRELSIYFDFSHIDWNLIQQKCLSTNIAKNVCIHWNDNPSITINDMSNLFHLSTVTIREYLKRGDKLGWCDFSTIHNTSHYHNPYKYDAPDNTIPIKCVENNVYFKGARLCSKLSENVFGQHIGDTSIRFLLKNGGNKGVRIKYSFEYVTKEEFNKAITDGLQCYGSPYSI